MFKRAHHQRIEKALRAFDADLLIQAHCYFGGGTAIALALDEYRESVDIDFICAGAENWRILRNAVAPPTLGSLVIAPLHYARETRTERDKIFTRLIVDGTPIKVEFVLEARLDRLDGALDEQLGVAVLSREDLYAEKLLANTDRGNDKSAMSRDLIDLGMMIQRWGPIPQEAWRRVLHVYGDAAVRAFKKNRRMLEESDYVLSCMENMKMDAALLPGITAALARKDSLPRMPVSDARKVVRL